MSTQGRGAPGSDAPQTAPSGGTRAGRHAAAAARRGRPVRRVLTWVGAIAFVLVLAVLGYAAFEYMNLDRNLQRSDVLSRLRGDQSSQSGLASDTNILLMGLDSRLDLKGKPLPQEMYDAMHTGDSSIGNMNTNVLMVLHIPADGKPATVIQIPRDDFVDYAGCYHGAAGVRCDGKIKEAYDHAFEEKKAELASRSGMSEEDKHAQARDAGRAAEILTVEKFLGNGLKFDHWVEVTMVAFYEIAQEVQPITVCLKKDTKDSFSGADFKAGKQEISAEQAIRFVRQRRDQLGDLSFSDLDRERRQQAFIASLMFQLKQRGTIANPARLNSLIGVATKNVAVDSNLNLMEFAGQAKQLSDGKVTFYTLPIEGSQYPDKYGAWSSIVNVPRIQATVKQLLDGASATPAPSATSTTAKPAVSVVNGSGVAGAGAKVLTGLVAAGYPSGGEPTTATTPATATTVEFPPGAGGPAAELAAVLSANVATNEAADVPTGTLRVVLGAGYQVPSSWDGTAGSATGTTTPGLPGATSSPSTSATPLTPTTVGTGGPNEDTSSSTLTAISGGSIPCVK